MDRRELIKRAALSSGIVMTAPLWITALNGCQSGENSGASSAVFSAEERALADHISDTILPGGDNPGAKDVQVVDCIEVLLKDCYSKDEADRFKKALSIVNDRSSQLHQMDYVKLDQTSKDEVLSSIEEEAYGSSPGEGARPYRMMKSLVLFAFYTSEPVMTQMLDYHPIATTHKGCIDITADQKVYEDNNV